MDHKKENLSTFHEDKNDSYSSLWMTAIHKKLRSLRRNKPWKFVELLEGKKLMVTNGIIRSGARTNWNKKNVVYYHN